MPAVKLRHAIERVQYVEEEDRGIKEWYKALEKELREKLEKEVACFRKHNLDVSGELVFGTPWEVIIEYAEGKGIDLIVIGSHGIRTREGRLVLGTTPHKLL